MIAKRETPAPVQPPAEIVLRMSQEEASVLRRIAFFDDTIPNATDAERTGRWPHVPRVRAKSFLRDLQNSLDAAGAGR